MRSWMSRRKRTTCWGASERDRVALHSTPKVTAEQLEAAALQEVKNVLDNGDLPIIKG